LYNYQNSVTVDVKGKGEVKIIFATNVKSADVEHNVNINSSASANIYISSIGTIGML
jgi:hypothetical protein